MRTFVVNLDKDVSKFRSVSRRLGEIGVRFERFPAVLGKDLSTDELSASVNTFRIWCAIGRRLELGELGCALSHLGVYRKMISEDVEIACVLEDDVICDERFPEQVVRTEHFLKCNSPRVVLLSDRHHSNVGEWCVRPSAGDWGTFAYMLNLSAARAILSANFPIQRPCDHWHRWRLAGRIELYHAYPTVCDYDHTVTSQTAARCKVEDYSLPHWLIHKSFRLIGLILDRILPL